MTSPMQSAGTGSGVELECSLFPLNFVLYLFSPKIVINGGPEQKVTWGKNAISLPPGRHHIAIRVPYLFFSLSRAEIVVDVPEGHAVQVQYRSPWWAYGRGKIAAVGAFPTGGGAPHQGGQPQPAAVPAGGGGGQQAGWYADPSGRHEQRYWNGSGWTADVADAGATSSDPL